MSELGKHTTYMGLFHLQNAWCPVSLQTFLLQKDVESKSGVYFAGSKTALFVEMILLTEWIRMLALSWPQGPPFHGSQEGSRMILLSLDGGIGGFPLPYFPQKKPKRE